MLTSHHTRSKLVILTALLLLAACADDAPSKNNPTTPDLGADLGALDMPADLGALDMLSDLDAAPDAAPDAPEDMADRCDGVDCGQGGRCMALNDVPTCACPQGFISDNLRCVPAPGAPSLDNLPSAKTSQPRQPDSFALITSGGSAPLAYALDASACAFPVSVHSAGTLSWTCSAPITCEVRVSVTDAAGLSDADALSISCPNTPPSASDVAITPDPIAQAGDTLTCDYTFSDADGDPDRSTIEWLVNGVAVASGPTFSNYLSGDSISCRVTPDDGASTSAPLTSPALEAP